MKLGRLALLACFFVFPPQLSNAVFMGKIRAATMVIEKSFLEKIKDQETLFLNSKYHNRGLAKDQVVLNACVIDNNTNYTTQTRDLELIEIGKRFNNEMRYSIFRLSKKDIATILSFYAKANGLVYFLLEPVKFKGDNRYLSYRIKPADEAKKIIPFEQNGQKQQGGDGVLFRETRLVLNPSPPASENLTEEEL